MPGCAGRRGVTVGQERGPAGASVTNEIGRKTGVARARLLAAGLEGRAAGPLAVDDLPLHLLDLFVQHGIRLLRASRGRQVSQVGQTAKKASTRRVCGTPVLWIVLRSAGPPRRGLPPPAAAASATTSADAPARPPKRAGQAARGGSARRAALTLTLPSLGSLFCRRRLAPRPPAGPSPPPTATLRVRPRPSPHCCHPLLAVEATAAALGRRAIHCDPCFSRRRHIPREGALRAGGRTVSVACVSASKRDILRQIYAAGRRAW